MIKIEGTGTIKGIRTDCYTNLAKEVELSYYLKFSYGYSFWFCIENGPTGYESFRFSTNIIDEVKAHGWLACMGISTRWDKLEISAEEMTKAIDHLIKVMQQNQVVIK